MNESGVTFIKCDRDTAEKQLSDKPVGTYLVRPSSRVGSYSLSYRTIEGRTSHLLLTNESNKGWTTDGISQHHATVRGLLASLPYGLKLDDNTLLEAAAKDRLSAYSSVPAVSTLNIASKGSLPSAGGYGKLVPLPGTPGYGRVPGGEGGFDPYGRVPGGKPRYQATPQQYGKVTEASVTVNMPLSLSKDCIKLMEGKAAFNSYTSFFRAQLSTLEEAKSLSSISPPVYTALVNTGRHITTFHGELSRLVQNTPSDASPEVWKEAIMRTELLQHSHISIQFDMRELANLVDMAKTPIDDSRKLDSEGGFARAIQSPLGSMFWKKHFGANTNSVAWPAFFQKMQDVLGADLKRAEVFARHMFASNKERAITAQMFNMFICWFDYDHMSPPMTIKQFLQILISRAEDVFFMKGFHSFTSRVKAEHVLSKVPVKSYLIRLSDSNAGVFILSYVDSKKAIRHRLLNQVATTGFVVEQKRFNTLPEMLLSFSSVLKTPVPKVFTFETDANSIYGGGDNLYAKLHEVAASPPLLAQEVYYYGKLVVSSKWLPIKLELRDTEIAIITTMAPLRTTILTGDIKNVAMVDEPPADMPANIAAFLIETATHKYIFACDLAPNWVTEIRKAAAAQQALPEEKLPALDKLLRRAVARQVTEENAEELKNQLFDAPRPPDALGEIDKRLLKFVNARLEKAMKKKNLAVIDVSKLFLDFNLNGAACSVGVAVRDSVIFTNSGVGPIDIIINPVQRDICTLKFVPNEFCLPAGESQTVDVTLTMNSAKELAQLLHVAVGTCSLFLLLQIQSKISEELKFEAIELGPKLGSGAFGQVFQGVLNHKQVAVKCVGFEPDYDQELGILRELRYHPNIVEYIGACKRKPFQGFIVLELIELGSLDRYIHDKNFDMTTALHLRVGSDVASGLAHLHKARIMHLDLKPANVLMASTSPHARILAKLGDFGLSQSRDSSASFKGDYVEGTLLYMAPEMLREKMFSFAGDIFSFAMTMWEMLNRVQPYSVGPYRALKKAAFEEVRERGELPSDLSEIKLPGLRNLLADCFKMDREQRPLAEEVKNRFIELFATLPRQALGTSPQ